MSTDPREFEHPIDGTTPNELPTVLGVGSLTPEAIEAAARALYRDWWNRNEYATAPASPKWEDAAQYHWEMYLIRAKVALTAAAPFIEDQAKAEALREAADAVHDPRLGLDATPLAYERGFMQHHNRSSVAAWLRSRAATIESEAS